MCYTCRKNRWLFPPHCHQWSLVYDAHSVEILIKSPLTVKQQDRKVTTALWEFLTANRSTTSETHVVYDTKQSFKDDFKRLHPSVQFNTWHLSCTCALKTSPQTRSCSQKAAQYLRLVLSLMTLIAFLVSTIIISQCNPSTCLSFSWRPRSLINVWYDN